jgi:hypothetical protein
MTRARHAMPTAIPAATSQLLPRRSAVSMLSTGCISGGPHAVLGATVGVTAPG